MYNNIDNHPLSPENTEIDYPRDNDDQDKQNDDFEPDNIDDMVDDDFLQAELSK
jgi:hypothetical protein